MNETHIWGAIRTSIAAALWSILVGPPLSYAYFVISHSRGPLHFRFIWDVLGLTYIIVGPSALIAGLIFGCLLYVVKLKVDSPIFQTILAGCLGFLSGYAGISLAHHLTDDLPLLPAPGVMSTYYMSAAKLGVIGGVMFIILEFLHRQLRVRLSRVL